MRQAVVVNTRPSAQAAELSHLLREAGLEPIEAPAIEIVAVEPSLQPIGEYAWLVLQSSNAGRFRPTASVFEQVLCGRATAAALDLQAAHTIDPFSAAAALDWLSPRLRPGERVLIPRAVDGRDDLVDGLRARGIEVDAPVCYRTRTLALSSEVTRRLSAGSIDAVIFCSPSAVRAFEGVDLSHVKVVCLGSTTAAAVIERGQPVAAVTESTSMESLVAAVRTTLSEVLV